MKPEGGREHKDSERERLTITPDEHEATLHGHRRTHTVRREKPSTEGGREG